MLSRRSVRIKVMQSLFTLETNEYSNPRLAEKHLHQSIQSFFDFYHYVIYSAFRVANYVQKDAEIKAAKFLPTDADKQINAKLLQNTALVGLQENEEFQALIQKRHFNSHADEHVIQSLYKELIETEFYQAYLADPLTNAADDFKLFKDLVFEIMLPNEVFVEHLGDVFVNRDDDGLDVERMLIKHISKARKRMKVDVLLFKNDAKRDELEDFATKLFRKTEKEQDFLKDEFAVYLKNWDANRLALVDTLLIEMALCEMLYFENIPLKVTMNEYIDISKEYSTPKSKEFINGVLDKMMKNYTKAGKIVKTGRGLIN